MSCNIGSLLLHQWNVNSKINRLVELHGINLYKETKMLKKRERERGGKKITYVRINNYQRTKDQKYWVIIVEKKIRQINILKVYYFLLGKEIDTVKNMLT